MYKVYRDGRKFNNKVFASYNEARNYVRKWMNKNCFFDNGQGPVHPVYGRIREKDSAGHPLLTEYGFGIKKQKPLYTLNQAF